MRVIRNCAEALKKYHENLRRKIYEYNERIRSTGYYLKPIHIVKKNLSSGVRVYYYFGRYWYKLVKVGSKIKWIYIGREKPDPKLPEPPINILEKCKVVIAGGDVYVDDICYDVVLEICLST